MPRHNVRPKVMTAIADLQTFTAGQLMRRAELEDITQARNQIQRLRDEGYLEQEQLPPVGPYRALTLYRLTSKLDERQKFADELLQYSPPTARAANEAVVRDVLRDASQALDRVETALDEMGRQSRSKAAVERLQELEENLKSAARNIETAFIEYAGAVSEDRMPDHPAAGIKARWRRVSQRVEELQDKWAASEVEEKAKAVSKAAGKAIATVLSAGSAMLVEGLKQTLLDKFDRAVVERFFNGILSQGSPESVIGGLIKATCSMTRDPHVLVDVTEMLSKNNLPWLAFDRENAHILTGDPVDWERWRESYEWVQNTFGLRASGGSAVAYSCRSDQLTREAYVGLTAKHSLSVVAPREISFLGPSEQVEPVLLFSDRHRLVQSFPCGYLAPERSLHAYGVVAQDILRIPGAPAARVAACLQAWGMRAEIEHLVRRVENMMTAGETMVVVQGSTDIGAVTEHVREHLRDACELEEKTEAATVMTASSGA